MLEARSLSKYYEHTAAGPRSQFHHPTGEILGDLGSPRQTPYEAHERGVLMLEARSLTKYYDHTAAVPGVSFTIQPARSSATSFPLANAV